MLVDYDEYGGEVTNFRCFLADWGTARFRDNIKFFGGTPVYAGPRSFENNHKDVFSFGRLALELFLSQSGFGHENVHSLIKET